MSKEKKHLYRVSFQAKEDPGSFEVVVESVVTSEFMGLITLEGFVFNDVTKQVILPAEDKARKRFGKIKRLHIPYHSILFIEEFNEEPINIENLPFIKKVIAQDQSKDN